ncbi:unnamed protein product, partial [Symbiodinium sp. CCMP2456]
ELEEEKLGLSRPVSRAAPAPQMSSGSMLNVAENQKRARVKPRRAPTPDLVERPEFAGLLHLLMHSLMRNKDWAGVISLAEEVFSNGECQKQLLEDDKDSVRLRKAVATHKIEFKKPIDA